jgi:predicted RNA-binding protein with PIN domain
MDILIVDGYNVIHAWPELARTAEEDLAAARHRLIEVLRDYQGYRGGYVIVVFDAHMTNAPRETIEDYGGVEVVYTREGVSADQYIERLVREELRDKPLTVATSDALQQVMVMREGVLRMAAGELNRIVAAARSEREQAYMRSHTGRANRLDGNIAEDLRKKLERMRRTDSLD